MQNRNNSNLPSIEELYFYPIKSFRGLSTRELFFDELGPLLDRKWMLVDENKRFLTQRQHPELARIGLAFHDEASIELSLQGHDTIDFGLDEREGSELTALVWKSEVSVFEVSGEVSEWVSGVLKKSVKLVRLNDQAKREFHPDFRGRSVRLVDTQPILVLGRSSLQELEKKAGVTLALSRFRPNIVINHIPAHAEDGWSGFQVERMEFKATKPCSRCKITTVHPLTGVVGEEPLKTLATYRKQEKGIHFGFYYAHLKPGSLKLGAHVSPH